eukprot:TRINITY_DN70936_c0_g1_i1.p1 TRINITY_DN70936_c0_g1~~TRINITY_DN70936_c0_g1_i1.p1  ORF type:complete len:749 (+),score=156.23 TRINITY_DN70936_c0_g1_i1:942-3188(+)
MQINKSLLALSNVIQKLSANPTKFINYRDSKLTRMLQPALGGNSKTAIICTVSKVKENYQETVNTVLFGTKAKNIKNSVRVNEVITDTNVKLMLAIKEIQNLKEQLMLAKGYRRVSIKMEPNTLEWEQKVEALKNELIAKEVALEAKDRILSQFEGIRNELASLTSQVASLTEKNEFLNHEVIEFRIENKEKQLDIDEKSQEIERLKSELLEKTLEIEALRQVQQKTDPQRAYSLPVAPTSPVIDTSKIEMENKRLTIEVERLTQNLEMEWQEKLTAAMEKDHKMHSVEFSLGESINQCEKLLGELKDAVEEKDRLREELEQANKDREEKGGEIIMLRVQVEEHMKIISELKATIESLQFGGIMGKPVNPMELEEDVIIVENVQAPERRRTSMKEIEEANQKLLKEIESLYQSIDQYKTTIHQLQEENQHLMEIEKSYERSTVFFKKELERLQTENQGMTIQLQGKFGRVQILEKDKVQLKNDLDSYRAENTKVKKTLERFNKENQRLVKELEAAESRAKEAGSAASIIKEKSAKIEELESKIRAIYEQRKIDKKELETVKQERNTWLNKVKEIQTMKFQNVEVLQQQLTEYNEMIEQFKSEKDLLIETNEAARKELEVLQSSFDILQEKNHNLEQTTSILTERLQASQEHAKKLEAELGTYKDSLEVERRRFFSALKQDENTPGKLHENSSKRTKNKGMQCEEDTGGKRYYLRSIDRMKASPMKASPRFKENRGSTDYYMQQLITCI